MTPTGSVWLVGAGPGDPGLFTLRGRELLGRAAAVVFDHLANPSLLDFAAPGAELIYVGKQAGRHSLKQDEINELLVRLAGEGKNVCRLKGGDPFIFGRGGEEALALAEHGVPFEIVPGISAASAVPAYAGVPVTHRGFAACFGAVTGHEDPTKETSDLDWPSLAAWQGTLVFFMGVKNLAENLGQLIAHGLAPDTPAALIRNGTLPSQRTIVGAASDLAAKAAAAGFAPPALLVVGKVVALRDRINWFETRPLFGRKVVVTRARQQASEMSARLAALGADVIEMPAIRIAPPADAAPLDAAAARLASYDWVVLTSVNGVDALFAAMGRAGKDARSFGAARVCAIGPATAERLALHGICADLVPEKFVAEELLAELLRRNEAAGKKFLLARADIARPMLRDELQKAGATVEEVEAYRTLAEAPDPARRDDAAGAEIVTFASSGAVRNFAAALGPERLARLRERARLVSIGPVTSQTMNELGLPVAAEAARSTIPALVDAVVNTAKEMQR
jgi:uroporphyrinogen III methyltransferase/synthase